MLASARQTINFFNLTANDTVLVCLNTAYIAGIMMLVRGLEAGAKIIAIEPDGNPLADIDEPIDFMAIVPLQLNNILEEPSSLLKIESIRGSIVGGAPVSPVLMKKLASTKAAVWATFGMTETLTHFALRQLNPTLEEAFAVLNQTKIKLDDRGCLVINSPVTNNNDVITNDLARQHDDHSFTWLGRVDNIINSGGLKLQIEALETKAIKLMNDLKLDNNFFIGALPDEQLNEKVCLLIEANQEIDALEEAALGNYFDKFERPKRIAYLPRFVYTPTGKINRQATLNLISLLS
jgi:O-succinylbenzoic acid--CoA ligase